MLQGLITPDPAALRLRAMLITEGGLTESIQYPGIYSVQNLVPAIRAPQFPARHMLTVVTLWTGGQQRRLHLYRHAPDKVTRGQVVLVTGALHHRDRQVPLQEFLERAKPAEGQPGLDDAERAMLIAMGDKVGLESRAVTEIVVQELVYL